MQGMDAHKFMQQTVNPLGELVGARALDSSTSPTRF
tara:strand:+ start:500 stop:607 length:108 start_codon:yes stop_codon:yes gene_type:complete